MQTAKKNEQNSKVVVKKVIAACRQDVFDAWTKPEIMDRWYVGGKGTAKCSADLRIGGKYTNEMFIEGDATCDAEGRPTNDKNIKSYMHSGEYLEINAPERIVFSWNSPSVQDTRVTIELREVSIGLEVGTEVTITHELLPESQVESHTQGWTYALNCLEKLF